MEKILELFKQLIIQNWHVETTVIYNEFHGKLQLNATAIYIGIDRKKPFKTEPSYFITDSEREQITIQHLETVLKKIKSEVC